MVSADYPLGIDCGFPQEGVDFVGAREAQLDHQLTVLGGDHVEEVTGSGAEIGRRGTHVVLSQWLQLVVV